jgi:sugar phosphate permease
VILGCISLAWAVAWSLYFRDDPGDHARMTVRELKSLPNYAERLSRKQEPVPWAALVRRMLPVTGVYFCYAWTLWLYLAWIPLFFLRNYGLNLQGSAVFSAGVFFAGVLGNTLGGFMSDWIFARTHDRNKARRNLIVIGFLCSLTSMVPLLFLHDLTKAAICLSLGFFFSEFTTGPLWAIPMDIAPRYSGSASGLMNSGTAFAIISPLVFGYNIDKTGNWELPFLGSIGLLLVGSILAFWMKPEEGLVGAQLSSPVAVKEATI